MRDLSEYGALIETEGELTAECEVWFHRNELRVHGHVAWVEGKHAGIAFSRALKPEVVLRYIGRPQPRPADELCIAGRRSRVLGCPLKNSAGPKKS